MGTAGSLCDLNQANQWLFALVVDIRSQKFGGQGHLRHAFFALFLCHMALCASPDPESHVKCKANELRESILGLYRSLFGYL